MVGGRGKAAGAEIGSGYNQGVQNNICTHAVATLFSTWYQPVGPNRVAAWKENYRDKLNSETRLSGRSVNVYSVSE